MGTVVIGSGCAGLNAADCLFDSGVTDILLITEGMNCGTSRNTGSDKQTYYKLSLSGDSGDSVGGMAESFMSEGADHDTALCMAAGSVQSFMKLVRLGLPFPQNDYGEYVGYRTDHDTRARATSVGPLTSRLMTEALEKSVRAKGIRILDNTLVCEILTDERGVTGVMTIDVKTGETSVIPCENAVVCTGGPALAYRDSVYPESQSGSMGLILRAGANLVNMDIWQYGLASVGFRWNVSGSYQQVLPRYFSVDKDGNEYEFLSGTDLTLRFRKGYEWPFDPKKAAASSSVDLAVLEQTRKGRRVYMDFRKNPVNYDFDSLGSEARDYLTACGATQSTPFERLMAMNAPAIDLYRAHGIDLESEPLEVKVCAQHLNGGAEVDINWETRVKGLYVCGEAAGTFGMTRPGGSALNATQVGSARAAAHIAKHPRASGAPKNPPEILLPELAVVEELRGRMSECAAIQRNKEAIRLIAADALKALESGAPLSQAAPSERAERLRAREALYAQLAVCKSILARENGDVLVYDGACHTRKPRAVNNRELWFETVWKKTRT